MLDQGENPQYIEHASVDTRVPSQGKPVIRRMAYNKDPFTHIDSYGMDSIQLHQARE